MIRCHYHLHCIDEKVTGPTSQLRSERVGICGSPEPESELNYYDILLFLLFDNSQEK